MQGESAGGSENVYKLKPATQDLREAVESVLEPESTDEGGKILHLDQEDVDTVLAADGDGNPVHGPFPVSGSRRLRDVFARRVPPDQFDDFQSEIYGVMEPFADPMTQNRPVLPGMAILEHIAYFEKEGIDSMSISWEGAAHHSGSYSDSDRQLIERTEVDEASVYEVTKQTPEGEEAQTAEAKVDYGSDSGLNDLKASLAGSFVARRDRSGDFLVSMEIDFLDHFDWEDLDFSQDDILYREIDREEDRFNTTSGVITDSEGLEMAEVEEVYGEIPGYDGIRSRYPEPKSPVAQATEAYFDAWESLIKASNPFLAD